MRIILNFILKNLWERKLRTLLMLLSVIFSVALFFAALTVGDSYMNAHIKLARGMMGKAAVTVSARPGTDGMVNFIKESVVPERKGIKNKVGIIQAYALFSLDNEFENFDLLAADLDRLNEINSPRIIEEKGFDDFSGNKIVIPEKFSRIYNIGPGDRFFLKVMGESISFAVAAIAANDTVFLRRGPGYNAIVPKKTMEKILNIKDEYSTILIEITEDTEVTSFVSGLSGVLPKECVARPLFNRRQLEADKRSKSMPFLLIGFFALTMSVFIIYSSYKVITTERIPVIGTFRSVGATEKRVKRILITESILYGLLGGVAGIPFGFGVLSIMLKQMAVLMPGGVEITATVSPVNILLSVVLAIVVSILSSYIPIRRASKLPVKDIILGKVEVKMISNGKRLFIGLILLVLSIILPYIVKGTLATIIGGISIVSLVVSTIITVPIMTAGIVTVLEPVYRFIMGNEGRLAARNIKWNKNINQNITLLVISISAVIVITVVGDSVRSYLGDVFKGTKMNGVSLARNISDEFVEKVENIENVKSILPVYEMYGVEVGSNYQAVNRIEGINDIRLYQKMYAIKYGDDDAKDYVDINFHKERNILVSHDWIKKLNMKKGDTLSLKTKTGIMEYRIVGKFQSKASRADLIIPGEYAVKDFKLTGYESFVYQATNIDSVVKEIRGLYNGKVNWTQSVDDINKNSAQIITSFFGLLDTLTYFILILGVVGIINNLIINYIQRKRFIAIYKSVGLSKVQHLKMTLIEGFTSGLIGSLIGLSIAFLEANIIFKVAGPTTGEVKPDLSPELFILAGVIGMAITLIGSIVPMIKGARLQIVEEIRFE